MEKRTLLYLPTSLSSLCMILMDMYNSVGDYTKSTAEGKISVRISLDSEN